MLKRDLLDHSAGRLWRARAMRRWKLLGRASMALGAVVVLMSAEAAVARGEDSSPTVRALFGLAQPSDGPFPANWYTVEDASNLTGLRVRLPLPEGVRPDCGELPDADRPSDCDDIRVLNSLDGFNLQPRVSIPFDGEIDLETATSANLYLVDIDRGERVGINQRVWDPDTTTLHFESDELLRQHARYAVIVTQGISDTRGRSVKTTGAFRKLLEGPCADDDVCSYRQAVLEGIAAAGRGGPLDQVVSASVFTTLSSTAVMEKIRDQIKATTPAPIDFLLGPGGGRTVFARSEVSGISFDRQMRVNAPLSPLALDLVPLDIEPGAVGQLAYGKFSSGDYQVQPAVFPVIGTDTGVPSVQRVNAVYCTLVLPSGEKPAAGWPVMILGHGGTQHKDDFVLRHAAIAASHGVATLAINAAGHGFGPLSRLRVRLTGGSEVGFLSGGRGIDQDGNNVIAAREGDRPEAPYTILWERDALRQTAADLLQLVRQVEVGVDVDGDATIDLDRSRIHFAGFSLGSNYGSLAATVDPSVRAVTLNIPGGALSELLRLGPARRQVFGMHLQARVPSLLNGPGIKALDGVTVPAPWWNEKKPLRDEPPVVNDVTGAMPIQELLDRTEWAFQPGNTLAFAPHLRREPLTGVPAKSVLLQFAKGDQNTPNPAMSAFVRAGDLADRTTFYLNKLSAEASGVPNYPHGFLNQPTSPVPLVAAVSRGAQHQIGTFFESNGTEILTPEPADSFETPIREPLPEILCFALPRTERCFP